MSVAERQEQRQQLLHHVVSEVKNPHTHSPARRQKLTPEFFCILWRDSLAKQSRCIPREGTAIFPHTKETKTRPALRCGFRLVHFQPPTPCAYPCTFIQTAGSSSRSTAAILSKAHACVRVRAMQDSALLHPKAVL
eukprot:1161833-Pelagomonas_calceolata.AAC.11